IHTFGANGLLQASDIPLALVTGCRVLYLGGYLLMGKVRQEELIPVFQATRAAGAKTVLDVVTPGPGDYLARLEKLLPHVDGFLPNTDEALLILGEKDPVRQAETFHRHGAQTAIITMGDQGSVLVTKGVKLRAPVFPIEYVDASGGGDAFAAGYMTGVLDGLDAEGCLRRGHAPGGRRGPRLAADAGVGSPAG